MLVTFKSFQLKAGRSRPGGHFLNLKLKELKGFNKIRKFVVALESCKCKECTIKSTDEKEINYKLLDCSYSNESVSSYNP